MICRVSWQIVAQQESLEKVCKELLMDVKRKQLGMMQQQSKGTMKKILEVMETLQF